MTYKDFSEYIIDGREIEFRYNGKEYFIGKGKNGDYLSDNSGGVVQYFPDRRKLLENAKVKKQSLEYIFDYITVDCIL